MEDEQRGAAEKGEERDGQPGAQAPAGGGTEEGGNEAEQRCGLDRGEQADRRAHPATLHRCIDPAPAASITPAASAMIPVMRST